MNKLEYIVALVLLCCWTSGTGQNANGFIDQHDNKAIDQLMAEDHPELWQFIKNSELEKAIDVNALSLDQDLMELARNNPVYKSSKDTVSKFLKSTTLTFESIYIFEDTLLSINPGDIFLKTFSINSQMEAAKVPVNVSGRLVLDDKGANTRLSHIAVGVSQSDWLEGIRAGIDGKYTHEKILDVSINTLELTDRALEMLKNEYKFRVYQQIINSEEYAEFKTSLRDTIPNGEPTLRLDSLKKYEQTQAIDSLYTVYLQNRNKYTNQERQELQAKLNQHKQELEKLSNPNELKQLYRQKNDTLSFVDRFMLHTKQLDIGLFSPSYSELTIRHVALNGIRYDWANHAFYSGAGYGTQFSNGSLLFNLNNNQNRWPDKKYFIARAGIGNELDDHLGITILRAEEQSDTTFTKRNQVVSIGGAIDLSKNWQTEIELALSDYTDLGQQIDNTFENGRLAKEKTAFQVRLRYSTPNGKLNIGTGYFYHGADFVTLGNPFLLVNREGILANLVGGIGRLRLGLDYKIGRQINTERLGISGSKDWQLLGNLSYTTKKNHTFSLTIAPNTFNQLGNGGFNTSSSSALYTLNATLQHNVNNGALLISTLNLSNYRSSLTVFDTISNQEQAFVMVHEMLQFKNGNSLLFSVMVGGDMEETKLVSDQVFAQSAMLISKSKSTTQIGTEVLKDTFHDNWLAGLTGKWQYTIHPKVNMGLSFSYRKKVKRLFQNLQPTQLWGQTNLSLNL